MTVQPGRPPYLQIADYLRGKILDGTYQEGDRLPSENDLVSEWGVAPNTVRAAIAHLRTEGRVVTRHGRGSFVRVQERRRKVGTDRSWADILARSGDRDATTFGIRRDPCPDWVAERLGIEAGEPVTVRHRLLRAEGQPPSFLSVSWHPEWIVQQIPDLANPTEHRGMKGMHEQLGLRLWMDDAWNSRNPTEEERALLQLEPGDTVTIQRATTYDQDRRPLYVIEHIGGGNRIEFGVTYGDIPPTD